MHVSVQWSPGVVRLWGVKPDAQGHFALCTYNTSVLSTVTLQEDCFYPRRRAWSFRHQYSEIWQLLHFESISDYIFFFKEKMGLHAPTPQPDTLKISHMTCIGGGGETPLPRASWTLEPYCRWQNHQTFELLRYLLTGWQYCKPEFQSLMFLSVKRQKCNKSLLFCFSLNVSSASQSMFL